MNLSREKTGMAPPAQTKITKRYPIAQKNENFRIRSPYPLGAVEDSTFEPELSSIRKVNYIFTFLQFTFVQPYDIIKRKNI